MTEFILYMIGMMYFSVNDGSSEEDLEDIPNFIIAFCYLLWPLSVLFWALTGSYAVRK